MLSGEPGRWSRPEATSSDSADESPARCLSVRIFIINHSKAYISSETVPKQPLPATALDLAKKPCAEPKRTFAHTQLRFGDPWAYKATIQALVPYGYGG